jgi:hypothetical protein
LLGAWLLGCSPACISSLRLAGGSTEGVRAVPFRASAQGPPPITATSGDRAAKGSWCKRPRFQTAAAPVSTRRLFRFTAPRC